MGTSTNNLIVLKELAGNPPVQLDRVQQFFAPHVDAMITFWVGVWILTSVVLLVKLAQEYIAHRKNSHR